MGLPVMILLALVQVSNSAHDENRFTSIHESILEVTSSDQTVTDQEASIMVEHPTWGQEGGHKLAAWGQEGGPDMWMGLATAAAHVEIAQANDPWLAWAERGNVRAYNSAIAGPFPEQRLQFLEHPEVEINLAADTGVKVFRMGVEWGRLSPSHPVGPDAPGVTDHAAMARYKEICQMIQAKGMKVMLTLFHHSMPLWSSAFGGWTQDVTIKHFLRFAQDVVRELASVVDFWVTFNEPHVYILLSNCAGLWPPGPEASMPAQISCIAGIDPGYSHALENVGKAHMAFYDWAHKVDSEGLKILSLPPMVSPLTKPRIGVAHNVAWNEPYGHLDRVTVMVTENLMKFGFIDAIQGHLDWLGLNYYGMELLGGAGPVIVPTEEYSESGRLVYPDGLYKVLMQFHERYTKQKSDVTKESERSAKVKFTSYIITENGISDSTDTLRQSYLVEHLLALREAQREGMNIEGYIHWTISDNWEWADGYCPKFGLVDVDRSTIHGTVEIPDFKRTLRKSYEIFKDIVNTKAVTQKQRDDAWILVHNAFCADETRPFCRNMTDMKSGLDEPVPRPFVPKDWRFHELTASDTDDKCFFTPWAPPRDAVKTIAVRPDAICDVLPQGYAKNGAGGGPRCARAVTLERERRCPRRQPEKQTTNAVCPGNLNAETQNAVTSCGGMGYKCCCMKDGKTMKKVCGVNAVGFNTCPSGMTSGTAAECAPAGQDK